MNAYKHFIPWNAPFLPQAAEHFFQNQRQNIGDGFLLDLGNFCVVTSGSRAGRRFLELLAELAQAENLILIPPRVLGIGSLPERLLAPAEQIPASEEESLLAWAKAIARSEEALRSKLFPGLSVNNLHHVFQRAELLNTLCQTLGAAGHTLASCAEVLQESSFQVDEERYLALASLEVLYQKELGQMERMDRESFRREGLRDQRFALPFRESKGDSKENREGIVLLGCGDIPPLTQEILSASPHDVNVYIFAPAEYEHAFSPLGVLDKNFWLSHCLIFQHDELCINTRHADTLHTNTLHITERPLQEAQKLFHTLAQVKHAASLEQVEDIALCALDASLAPYLHEAAKDNMLRLHASVGIPLAHTQAFRCLRALSAFFHERNFRSLKELLLQPDILHVLARESSEKPLSRISKDLHAALDAYQRKHLLYHVEESSLEHGLPKFSQDFPYPLHSVLSTLIKGSLREIFHFLFADRELYKTQEEHKEFFDSVVALVAELERSERMLASYLEEGSRPCTTLELLDLVLERAQSLNVPQSFDKEAVELLGWLELAHDDAPFAFVAGCHEGFFPESLTEDAFLPDALRSKLGLLDNEQRLARDVYALQSMLSSKTAIHFFVSRKSSNDDPRLPGRLWYQQADSGLSNVLKAFFVESEGSEAKGGVKSGIKREKEAALSSEDIRLPPKPTPVPELPHSLPVTAFRAYLECPYRFYLRFIENLRPLEFDAHELDAPGMGSLLHAILDDFAKGSARDSKESAEILETLLANLETCVTRDYILPLSEPALRVQIFQLKSRLERFAHAQASRRQAGWRIEASEWQFDGHLCRIEGALGSLGLRGRIDRIDRHEQTGSLALIDYKTGDEARDPGKTHRAQDAWVDLQLPLYEYAAQKSFDGQIAEVGYFCLPQSDIENPVLLASWTPEEYADALRVAAQVVDDILAQRFWPPKEIPSSFDPFALICRRKTLAEELS